MPKHLRLIRTPCIHQVAPQESVSVALIIAATAAALALRPLEHRRVEIALHNHQPCCFFSFLRTLSAVHVHQNHPLAATEAHARAHKTPPPAEDLPVGRTT
jgi:ABC-type nickel/cobalt efflux system permease component RcnA